MKLPSLFQPSAYSTARPAERVDPPWQTLVMVCGKCKGSRKGPEPRAIRKGVKLLLGKQKRLRIIEVDCLGVCPDDAVTVCTVRHATGASDVRLVRTQAELEELARDVDPARI